VPVVVTGASGFIGRSAVAAFTRTSPEVRAAVRNPAAADPLRALGAKVAIGDLFDVETLALVMQGAHTLCHLAGGLAADDEEGLLQANLRTAEAVLAAALVAGVKRFLMLSFPGASPDSSNAFLRAKGMAEEAVADSGVEYVIVRSNHVYGPGSPWLATLSGQALAKPAAIVVGEGTQLMAPVYVTDVVAVLVGADDRRGVASGIRGLNGPDLVSADRLTDLIAGKRRMKIHLGPAAAARAARFARRPAPEHALEVLAAQCVAEPPDAAAEFGVALTPLRDGLAASLER
jgi:NADH dehydrogenase